MEWLVAPGIALTIAGLGALMFCILKAVRVRRGADSEDDQRKTLQQLVAINFAGVALSAFGLILITMGIFF